MLAHDHRLGEGTVAWGGGKPLEGASLDILKMELKCTQLELHNGGKGTLARRVFLGPQAAEW